MKAGVRAAGVDVEFNLKHSAVAFCFIECAAFRRLARPLLFGLGVAGRCEPEGTIGASLRSLSGSSSGDCVMVDTWVIGWRGRSGERPLLFLVS